MRFILVIILLVQIKLTVGQSIYFDQQFDIDYGLSLDTQSIEFINGLVYNPSNESYYILSDFNEFAPNNQYLDNPSIYILDKFGNVILRKVYRDDTTWVIPFIIELLEEKIVIAGRYDEVGAFSSDYFIMETDFEGNMLDFDDYGLPKDSLNFNSEALTGLVKAYNGDYVSAGYRFAEEGSSNFTQIWINKILNDSIVWETIIDNPNLIDVAIDIERNVNDSTYIVYTEQEEIVSGDDVQHIVLVKIDDNGNIINQSANLKTDSNTNNTNPTDMAIDVDGNIVIVGRGSGLGFICKLDSAFNIIWDKSFESPNGVNTLFKHCKIDYDGNYIVAGDINLPDSLEDFSEKVGMLVKFDALTGDTLWYKEVYHKHPIDSLVARQHYTEAFCLAPDSGYVLGGYVFYHNEPQAGFATKVDKNGCQIFNCGLPVDTAVGLLDNYNDWLIELSPNPAKDFLFVESNAGLIEYYEIINANGLIVNSEMEVGLYTRTLTINISQLNKGIYFISFNGNNDVYKFVKI